MDGTQLSKNTIEPNIKGFCAQKFAAVKDAFEQNFLENNEIGASVSICHGNDVLVHLWGGMANVEREIPWNEDTLVNVWSTTKGVMAACIARAVELDHFQYTDLVSDYWPEFTGYGLETLTIAGLMSHQAGLSGFAEPIDVTMFYDLESATETLLAQTPFWTPGTQTGYHAVTSGFLISSLLKRIMGVSLKDFVRTELSDRLNLDLSIGLDGEAVDRAAQVYPSTDFTSSSVFSTELNKIQQATMLNPIVDPNIANSPEWRAAEIPAGNGHATAQSLAKLYAGLAGNGTIDGSDFIGPSTQSYALSSQIVCEDAVLALPLDWACGFLRSGPLNLYGPDPDAFGHTGWGGSFAIGHPATGHGLAYIPNKMGIEILNDPRSAKVISAY
ncbi:MAG: serine hydrolase domain-containing protein [Pseudomonadota bacterium]